MILDYHESTQCFTLRVPRAEGKITPEQIVREHGLDFSLPRSSPTSAVLYTKEPYAAAAFAQYATPFARCQIQGILNEVEASWATDSSANIRVPVDKELWPFQRASVAYALRRKHSLVGDQPGLGKTPIAIAFANEIDAKRVLVVCPANIRIQWVNRIREWSTMRWPHNLVYPILSGRHGVHPTAQWTVVSYDLARTPAIGRALARQRYDLLILDEAHYLKTIDSGRTHAVFGDLLTGSARKAIRNSAGDIVDYEFLHDAIGSRCDRILALTGTPLPNRPREAYTLARNLNWDSIDWQSEAAFKEKYNPSARLTGFRKDGSAYEYTREEVGRVGEFQNRLRANFMVRHMKRDVLTQLKLPVYDIVQVEETGPVKQALAAESMLDIDPDTFDGADAETMGHIAVVRRMMGAAIAPQVASYADMLLDGGEDKIVIFAWHTEVLDILQKELAEWGVLRIDGSTSSVQRQKRVELFQKDPKFHVMLGNTLSLGTGTDGLQTVCSHCLLAEPEWVPGNNMQAIDRLDRGGQTRTVQADLFVAPNSLLEKILASSLRKLKNTDKALDHQW